MRTFSPVIALALLIGLVSTVAADDITPIRHDGGWTVDGVALDLPIDAHPERLVEAADGRWLTATTRGGEREAMHLLRIVDGAAQVLPTPTIEVPGVIVRPTPIADRDGLAALMWFEGEQPERTALRWSRWTGEGWGTPTTLSATGPGTQTALRVVVLADGSWLAAWSRFDGDDDEIVWSRFDGAAWSAPATLTANAVPDLTPALVAHNGGALIAWSGFDGRDYRVHTARFADGTWSAPNRLDGLGAVRPEFAATDVPVVVYRQTVPAQWTLVELDGQASPKRAAATDGTARPRVIEVLDAGLRVQPATAATTPGPVLAWTSADR